MIVGGSMAFVDEVSACLAGRWRIRMVGAALSKREAIERTVLLRPDVVVLDINIGYELGGIDAGKAIREVAPSTAIVVISPYTDWQRLSMFPRQVGLEWSYVLSESARDGTHLADVIHGASWSIPHIDPAIDREAIGAVEVMVDDTITEILSRASDVEPGRGGQMTRWHGVPESFSIEGRGDDRPPERPAGWSEWL